jgi:DNA-directed RNA polymerase specialized sigma24 family protein
VQETVTTPAAAGTESLTTKDFERVWKRHVRFVRNLAAKKLRRFAPVRALHRVRAHVKEGTLPSYEAVCAGLRGDLDLVEDVVQDVATALWTHFVLGKFLGTAEQDTRRWLCKVTAFAAWRAADHTATVGVAGGVEAPDEYPELGEAVEPTPSAEFRATLREVFTRLPAREQTALLFAAEGGTHEEFAAEFGTTVQASRSLRFRGAQRAADMLTT